MILHTPNLATMNKSLFFITFCLLTTSSALQAQITNVWKGGFPGRETDWHCNKNWSLGKAPDVFDAVVIPDVSTKTQKYPIVTSGDIEVQSIEIQAGAMLTLHRSARIFADRLSVEGVCKGCERRVVIEGGEPDVATSFQQ